jgi:DNA gyrase subunit B/topoisomerase-4 subunit B
VGNALQAGQAHGALKKLGAARAPARPSTFTRTRRSSQGGVRSALIRERLEVISYLHKGVKVTFEQEATGEKEVFTHEDGIAEYLRTIIVQRGAKPIHETAFAVSRENGLRLDCVLQWTEATDEHIRSYVNGIPTASGGTHENGLRAGIGKAVRNFIETHNLTPKGVTLTSDDIREGLTGFSASSSPSRSSRGRPRTG